MRPRLLWPAVVSLLLVSGCAGPTSGPLAAHGGPCLPAGVSPQFFFWPVVSFRTVNLLTEDGDFASASWVLHRRGRTAVAVMWVESDLITVDPSPETDAPEWVDLSLVIPMDGRLVLRRQPEAPCRWERWDSDEQASLPRPRGGRVLSRAARPSSS